MTSFAEIAVFIAQEVGEPLTSITAETRILHDLGVYGDDADEFIIAFSARFNVDMAEFPFREHFYGEPHLFSWGGLLQDLPSSTKRPLTVAALVQAAERGSWVNQSSGTIE